MKDSTKLIALVSLIGLAVFSVDFTMAAGPNPTGCSLTASCNSGAVHVKCSSNDPTAYISISDGNGHNASGTTPVERTWGGASGSGTADCTCEGETTTNRSKPWDCGTPVITPTPSDTPLPPGCSCSGWSDAGACGTAGCGSSYTPQTRTCSNNCATESRCWSTAYACIVGGGGGGGGGGSALPPAAPSGGVYYIPSPRSTVFTSYTAATSVNGTYVTPPSLGVIAGSASANNGNVTGISVILRRMDSAGTFDSFYDWNGSSWATAATASFTPTIIGLNSPFAFWQFNSPPIGQLTPGYLYRVYVRVDDSESLTSGWYGTQGQIVDFLSPPPTPPPSSVPDTSSVRVDMPNYCSLSAPAVWVSWQYAE